TIGHAPAADGVEALGGPIAPTGIGFGGVVARRDVTQRRGPDRLAGGAVGVEQRGEEALLLGWWQQAVEACDQRRPDWRGSAGAAVGRVVAAEDQIVERFTGKGSDVGDDAAVDAAGGQRGDVHV